MYNSLLCVKSISTILLIIAMIILAFIYPEDYEETMKTSVTMVVTFYFAHQNNKQNTLNKPDEPKE